jgi:hypothetical protein
LQHDFTRSLAPAYEEGPASAAEIIKQIADAFGVQPDSLTLIENDDFVDSGASCHPGEDPPKRSEELKRELAESRKESERYRKQVEALLKSFNNRLH